MAAAGLSFAAADMWKWIACVRVGLDVFALVDFDCRIIFTGNFRGCRGAEVGQSRFTAVLRSSSRSLGPPYDYLAVRASSYYFVSLGIVFMRTRGKGIR